MIYYVVTQQHSYTMKVYAESWEGLRLLFYEDLFRARNLPVGAYIFTDIDRLTTTERQLAAAIWRQLTARAPDVKLLNDPERVLCRYELMCELASTGINRYRARRATEGLSGLHYPVFIRSEREHNGALTPLLFSASAVRGALLFARVQGYRIRDLLVVEFCDTSDAAGLFRKYSAFIVGAEVLPRHLLVSTEWHLKKRDLNNAEVAREVETYLMRNPHQEAIRAIFRQASIKYGRIDYSLADDKIHVWEINTNPMVRNLAERMSSALARLDPGLPKDLPPIPIQLDPQLLAAAEVERYHETKALRRRDRRRVIIGELLESPIVQHFRRAARHLR